MRHDPGRAAAAYLTGELGRRVRARFERHLLDCEDCWATPPAPADYWPNPSARPRPSVRERIRNIAALPRPRRSWPEQAHGGGPTCWSARRPRSRSPCSWWSSPPGEMPTQPAPLTAAAHLYRTAGPPTSTSTAPPVRTIAGYDWQATTQADLAGIPATIHTYTAPTGQKLLVISSPQRFPRPRRRRHHPCPSWIATVDGTTMLCVDQPGISWLAVAATPDDARTAGHTLELTPD